MSRLFKWPGRHRCRQWETFALILAFIVSITQVKNAACNSNETFNITTPGMGTTAGYGITTPGGDLMTTGMSDLTTGGTEATAAPVSVAITTSDGNDTEVTTSFDVDVNATNAQVTTSFDVDVNATDAQVTTSFDVDVNATGAQVTTSFDVDVNATDATEVTTNDIEVSNVTEVTTSFVDVDVTTDSDRAGVCCPNGSQAIGNTCFIISKNLAKYDDALISCQSIGSGASLAKIEPLANVTSFLVTFLLGRNAASIWIGLRRQGTDLYRWAVDDTTPTTNESFWGTGAPLGANGIDCVMAFNNSGGMWQLVSCFTLRPYICQFDMIADCDENSTILSTIQSLRLSGAHLPSPPGPPDINECLDNPCDEHSQDCVNNNGSFSCMCKVGFDADPSNALSCVLSDLCNGVNCDGSDGHITCVYGSCQCADAGYELHNIGGPCININECLKTPCDTNESCVDTPGSFTCSCRDGFEPATAPATGCIQIELQNHTCSQDQCLNGGTCIQNDKYYIKTECICPMGFQGTRCEAVMDGGSIDILITLTVVAVIVSILFIICCCCCLFVSVRAKSQSNRKMVYKYKQPAVIPQQFVMQSLPSTFNVEQRTVRNDEEQRTVSNDEEQRTVSNDEEQRTVRNDEDVEMPIVQFPRIIRNRGAYRNTAMDHTPENEDMYTDEDIIQDEKRLNHFERIFYAANELNSHMSSRGDASSAPSVATASDQSTVTSAHSEITGETFDENHEFDRPYTTDGTANT